MSMCECVIGGWDRDVAGREDCWGDAGGNAGGQGPAECLPRCLSQSGPPPGRMRHYFHEASVSLSACGLRSLGVRCTQTVSQSWVSRAIPNHVKSWFPSGGTEIITSEYLSPRSPGPQ